MLHESMRVLVADLGSQHGLILTIFEFPFNSLSVCLDCGRTGYHVVLEEEQYA